MRNYSESHLQRWTSILVAVPSIIALAMHAYLGSFSRFIADDYCSASRANQLGILRAAWFWYRSWNGRYSANLLDAIFAQLGVTFTPVVTALVLILWLAVLTLALRLVMTTIFARGNTLLAFASAAAILMLTLVLSPAVSQSLYWGQGMRSVVPPLILITLFAALVLWSPTQLWTSGRRTIWMAVGLGLTFIAGGFSETFTAFQLAALVLALAFLLRTISRSKSQNAAFLIHAGLLGALLAFVAVIAAPGNAIRQSFSPPPPALSEILTIAAHSYGIFIAALVISSVKLFALIAALGVGFWVSIGSGWKARKHNILWIILIGAILTFSCFPPAAFGQSDAPPDRTLLIPTLLLVLTIVALGASLAGSLPPYASLQVVAAFGTVLLLIVVSFTQVSNIISVQPEYAAYARAWERFNAQMLAYRATGVTETEISTDDMNVNNWTELNVLGDNPKFWLNICVSDYYGVRVISNSP